MPVTLAIDGEAPSSVAHTLFFPDPRSVKVEKRENGEPDCTQATEVRTPGRFAFWPVGCFHEDDECDALRVLFVDLTGSQPNLSPGRLFTCKVRIGTSAAPGTYPVENREPDAAARGGREVGATAGNGAVTVLQPPGGGGCAMVQTGADFTWSLAFLIAALLLLWRTRAFRIESRTPAVRSRVETTLSVAIAIALLTTCRPAWAQGVQVAVEGEWGAEGAAGTWSGQVVVGNDGSISGHVRFNGLNALPVANVLAVWSRGAIRSGSLFHVDRAVRAGRLRGTVGTKGLEGELTTPDGTEVRWVLRAVRAQNQKALPPAATSSLAEGRAAVVVVGIDPYEAVREARSKVGDLGHLRWDTPEAVQAYFATIGRLRAQLISEVGRLRGTTLLRALPRVTSVWVRVESREALEGIRALPFVRSVEDPLYFRPSLGQSLPLINQPAALGLGFTGRGSDVVILDTGWTIFSGISEGNSFSRRDVSMARARLGVQLRLIQ